MTSESESQAQVKQLGEAVAQAIRLSQEHFLRVQYPEGYWWDELESNPTMEAEHLLLTYFLDAVEPERWRKIVADIRSRQRDDGTWGMYYGGPGDLSTSVECYFALKLAGVPADDPAMRSAREFILSRGGVPRVRIFTKIWLSLFGQWEWKGTPVMPPELMFLPTWSPINIYAFSSWARATIVPMLILLTRHPVKPVPESARIDELYPVPRERVDYSLPRRGRPFSWAGFFRGLDKALRLYERSPLKPLRGLAIRKAEQWIVAHQEADGSWGGIQPPWVYSLLALKTLGYPNDHPVMQKGIQGFKEAWSLCYDGGEKLRVQACLSPLWDTCLAMMALLDSGMAPDHPALQRAARWLLDEQISTGGDWQVKAKRAEPGGWAFEFENDLYPDIDDTSIIVIDLHRVRFQPQEDYRRAAAIRRGVAWLLAMQSSNGGWASFDKDNTNTLVARLPFCDFGEVLDPPSADVTAHVLEMLGRLGYDKSSPVVRRALGYLRKEQEPDGPWFGRWGVNYVYGTGAVLPALQAVGEDMSQPYVRRAVQWLVDHQDPDGGWGESCASYVDPSLRGRGESTASQTAWALLALLAAGEVAHPATERGVRYLVETQRQDGTWDEPQFTGCGFPGYGIGDQPERYPPPGDPAWQGLELGAGFMINYHMYRDYFPLAALGRYRKLFHNSGSVSGGIPTPT
ncbi:MAG: squalene--hopene cyclase [Chloroflexi bacterium]|nr:squalene--hopene cyclase [Chloroflexota bacterium]